ncbi:EI24 domain-containing protein [Pontixanthobacter aquaemixtae]|uniref:CysZ-like protein n=1 Tax=Pontixanthobacter aquaemixtae TaxID=1958940 RepID=A0A844ZUP8_9SPHN|nr:EI24 domain-containing protein [Pontixanthobacter aquaemixtae]MXO91468.1 hypothetical protein [Pontixanthobacter aquaemixtae]
MTQVPAAMSRAIAQLGDPKIVKLLVRTVVITLVIFALLGAGLWFGLYKALESQGFALGAEIGGLIAILLTIVGGWVLFRMVALAVLQFFADEVVQAVEEKHYRASLGQARKLGWREELGQTLRSIGRVIAVNALALLVAVPLLLTAIGPAVVFWAANAWLLGRELQDMVWLRHSLSPDEAPPLGKLERFFLGGIIAALMAIPLVNFLAPIIGAASAAHLVHGHLGRRKIGAHHAA